MCTITYALAHFQCNRFVHIVAHLLLSGHAASLHTIITESVSTRPLYGHHDVICRLGSSCSGIHEPLALDVSARPSDTTILCAVVWLSLTLLPARPRLLSPRPGLALAFAKPISLWAYTPHFAQFACASPPSAP
jgi:hypothetical protein